MTEKAHVIFKNDQVVAVCLEGNEKAIEFMIRQRGADREHWNHEHGLTDHPGIWEKMFKARPYDEHTFWRVEETIII
jgi:hypothetical protein